MICKKPVSTVAAIVLGLSLLAGCGKDDEDDDEDDGLTNGDLVGAWQSACIASGAGAWEKKSIKFTGETFAFTTNAYSDESCATLVNSLSASGTYLVNGTSASTTLGGTATNVDYTFTSYVWDLDNEAQAEDYAKACGTTALGDTVDVKGKACDFGGGVAITFHSPAYGTVATEDGKLLITDSDSNGGTPETRSTALYPKLNLGWEKTE
jgi:hypothetical protein